MEEKYFSYVINIMVADDVVMQEARASSVMVTTLFWNILPSTTELWT